MVAHKELAFEDFELFINLRLEFSCQIFQGVVVDVALTLTAGRSSGTNSGAELPLQPITPSTYSARYMDLSWP